MGVHGLSSFILRNCSLFLKPHELSNCYLVIDGNNIAHGLFEELKSHSAFGGDYDEYSTVVRSFMLRLKRCKINPIILLDGGCQKTKIRIRLNRRRQITTKLNYFCGRFSEQKFFSLFMLQVFTDVVTDMGFICIQCDLEADGEIAAVARKLNCPVLSDDSDYFIYDVVFIPFSKMIKTPVQFSNSDKYCMKCFIYVVDDFLKAVGLDKSLLPILATLLGNDHVENKVFKNFFNHIRMPEQLNKSTAPSMKRIHCIVQWLKNENKNSAVTSILRFLNKKNAEKASKLFTKTINYYNSATVSEAVSNELTNRLGNIHLPKNEFIFNWPPEIAKLLGETKLPGFLTNMILYQIHLTPMQVENIQYQSSHFISLNLIRKIYAVLTPYLKAIKPLKLYLIINKQYTCLKIYKDPSKYMNLDDILKQSWEDRLKLLCDIICIPMDNLEFLQFNFWAIIVLSFFYWVKECKVSVKPAHIHAFVIMLIANQIVQTKVGYYRNSPEFIKHFQRKLEKLNNTNVILEEKNNFQEMLSNVNYYECLVVQKELIPLRQTTEKGSGREYSLSTIHLFNSFQSCLYYIMVINGLLKFPLPHVRVGDFYSGTLLFNLYVHIKSQTNVEKFGAKLFLPTPNLNQIYKYLSVKLSGISGVNQIKGRIQRRKRTKKNNNLNRKVIENIKYFSDDDEYDDENNHYAVLRKIHL